MDPITDQDMESLRGAIEEYMTSARKMMMAVLDMDPHEIPQEVMMATIGVALADYKVQEVGKELQQKLEKGGDYDLNLDDLRSQTIRTKVEEFRHGPVPTDRSDTPNTLNEEDN